MLPTTHGVPAGGPIARKSSIALVLLASLFALQLSATASTTRGSAWTSAALDPGLTTVGEALQEVIVSAAGGVEAAADAVRRVGGTVESPLPIVEGVEAKVPANRLPELATVDGVTGITYDRRARFEEFTYDETTTASNFTKTTQATSAWAQGNLGAGVGVAVLDTGVSEMNDFAGRLVHGPDLSGEGTLVDSYGHGTVMAGVVAGSGADSATNAGGAYTGVAPKAHVVAVKVAGRNGVVDVSTMLQGMHWVQSYKDQFNIRVMNLSWGTPSTQDPVADPLNYAVQRLWKNGIVVVVAAGNSGPNKSTIMKPADDPMVISVGAYDDKADLDTTNDALSSWSSRGPTVQGVAKPDLVVPGRTLIAARSFGSKVEADNPKALISPSYIKGSGTSQGAAVTSGLAALILAKHPTYTPDQVKHILKSTASPMGNGENNEGKGRTQLAAALVADPGPAYWQTSTAGGLGSIESSRGGRNVETDCLLDGTIDVIQGEIDVRCEAWDPAAWTGSSWTGSSWTGSSWTGSSWTGSSWTGSSWTGSSWTGSSWTGAAYGDDDEFLTAWWGNLPPFGSTIAGEPTEPATETAPTQIAGACRIVNALQLKLTCT